MKLSPSPPNKSWLFRGQKNGSSQLKTAVSDLKSKFCHAVLNSREQQVIPPDQFEIRPRPIDCDRGRDHRQTKNLWLFWGGSSIKSVYRACYLVLIYTPKAGHRRSFVTGGSFFARQMVAKMQKKYTSIRLTTRQACTLRHSTNKGDSAPQAKSCTRSCIYIMMTRSLHMAIFLMTATLKLTAL